MNSQSVTGFLAVCDPETFIMALELRKDSHGFIDLFSNEGAARVDATSRGYLKDEIKVFKITVEPK